MRIQIGIFVALIILFFGLFLPDSSHAQTQVPGRTKPNFLSITPAPSASPSATFVPKEIPRITPRPDITTKTTETIEPLKLILSNQKLGHRYLNPVKYAIRSSVAAGVPPNTIALLLLLPVVATIIAGARHLVGIRGFGIFLPAALSVVFVAIGPVTGLALFLVIISVSTATRLIFRKIKIRLQYLPRTALILWATIVGVLGILFLAPIINGQFFSNVSIFPVLILTLLAEDFTKTQIGKSFKTAFSLTAESLVLALVSFLFLSTEEAQKLVLLNPEWSLIITALVDFLLGKYKGLRIREYWRFRKLILS